MNTLDLREKRKYIEQPADTRSLKFLYHTFCGRACLKVLTRPIVSKAVGFFLSSRLSSPLIKSFVKNNHIDTTIYEECRYRSYNDFFTRKIKDGMRPFDDDRKHFVSPCDSKLSVFEITGDSTFKIKNSLYTVRDLLDGDEISAKFSGGYCFIFRLCVDDYHRYFQVDTGKTVRSRFVKGILHTVRPIALESCNIYKRNCREYTIQQTDNFGTIAYIEVGAMLVGKIKNHQFAERFNRGDEKGYFEFGGSTVIILTAPNTVVPDSDILINTENNRETIIKAGETIGNRCATAD